MKSPSTVERSGAGRQTPETTHADILDAINTPPHGTVKKPSEEAEVRLVFSFVATFFTLKEQNLYLH